MIPPTPTPQPLGQTIINLPTSVSLWSSTSTAIQLWYWLGDYQPIFQLLVIVLLVVLALFGVNRWVKELTGKDLEG